MGIAELADALRALGVGLPDVELREMMFEVNSDGTGRITFPEFKAWWDDLVAASPVSHPSLFGFDSDFDKYYVFELC